MKLIPRLGAALLLALAGCAEHATDSLTLSPVAYDALPGWRAEHPAALLPAILRDCAVLAHMPAEAPLGGQGEAARLGGTAGQWAPACAAARRLHTSSDAVARGFLERAFQPYRVSAQFRPDPLFTGYYEPELVGDLKPGALCATPVYEPPPDLVQTSVAGTVPGAPVRRVYGRRTGGGRWLPYWSRTAIEDGALEGRGLELLWLADPVAAFFLQIQGSGRVILPDGRMLRVGYAAQNGQPFVDVGHLLLTRGELSIHQLTMQDVRQWLSDHPVESRAVMDANPSYVFFRAQPELGPEQGPLGALGVPLAPGRSIAVDPRFIPLGAPVWVDTRDAADGQPLQRLMLAQDVGGAIRGPARGDIFFGWGQRAEDHAGRMWGRGGEYVLLPREAEPEAVVASNPAPLQIAYLHAAGALR